MNAPEQIPNGDGIEQQPAYTEEQISLAATIMTAANAVLGDYAPVDEMKPEEFVKAVESTPVHVAFGAVAVATGLEHALVFTRNDLGEIVTGTVLREDFFAAFPPPKAPAADDLLLVQAKVNVPCDMIGVPDAESENGFIDLGGQFVTTRARLDAAIGKTVVIDVVGDYTYDLAADQFTVLSENQNDVEIVLGLLCTDDELEEGDDYTIVGINPLDYLIPEISLATADSTEEVAA